MTQTLRQYTTKNDVKIMNETTGHKGFVTIKFYQLQFRTFAGTWTSALTRELIEKHAAVGVLAYDPKLKKVVLIEQFRPGCLEDSRSPWQIEIIAGLVDTKEHELEIAKREAYEEAGLIINQLELICDYWVSPGVSNEKMSIYYSEIDVTGVGGIHGLDEEGEDIKVHVLDTETAFAWLDEGLINNASTIIALQWLRLKIKAF